MLTRSELLHATEPVLLLKGSTGLTDNGETTLRIGPRRTLTLGPELGAVCQVLNHPLRESDAQKELQSRHVPVEHLDVLTDAGLLTVLPPEPADTLQKLAAFRGVRFTIRFEPQPDFPNTGALFVAPKDGNTNWMVPIPNVTLHVLTVPNADFPTAVERVVQDYGSLRNRLRHQALAGLGNLLQENLVVPHLLGSRAQRKALNYLRQWQEDR